MLLKTLYNIKEPHGALFNVLNREQWLREQLALKWNSVEMQIHWIREEEEKYQRYMNQKHPRL